MKRSRLPRREVLLFLAAILVPCLVLAALSLRMLEQERQLEEKRAADVRQRRRVEVSHELLTLLERIKADAAQAPSSRLDEAVAFGGKGVTSVK